MVLRKLLRSTFLLAAIGLAACDSVETTHFLTEPSETSADAALVGTWIASAETVTDTEGALSDITGRALVISVDPVEGDQGEALLDMAVVGVNRTAEEDPKFFWFRTRGHTSAIGDRTFLNLESGSYVEIDPNAPLTSAIDGGRDEFGRQIVEYRIEDGSRLHLYLMNAEQMADATDAGALAGTVKREKYSTHVTVTAESDALAAFIAGRTRNDVFHELGGYFTRVNGTPED